MEQRCGARHRVSGSDAVCDLFVCGVSQKSTTTVLSVDPSPEVWAMCMIISIAWLTKMVAARNWLAEMIKHHSCVPLFYDQLCTLTNVVQ